MEIQGSSKSIRVLSSASPIQLGMGIMQFEDWFSVFDFGRMPQPIPHKGLALKYQSLYWFEKLQDEGIQTHLIQDLGEAKIKIKLGYKLGFREMARDGLPECCLLPLEIIIRNYIPRYSSAMERLERLGLEYKQLSPDLIELNQPLVEFFSKGEKPLGDQYLEHSWVESKLGSRLVDRILEIALDVNNIMNRDLSSKQILNLDGKLELIKFGDELMVADSLGTLDENRFLYRGYDLSKQILRDYYRSWYSKLKSGMISPPPELPRDFLELISGIYLGMTQRIAGRSPAPAPDLDELIKKLESYGFRRLI